MNKQRLIAAALTIAFAMTTLSCSALAEETEASEWAAERAAAEQSRAASNEHLQRVLQRIALRHDAEAAVLRFQLGPLEPLAACEQYRFSLGYRFQAEPASEAEKLDCKAAEAEWRAWHLRAVLQAPDLDSTHLFAAMGRGVAEGEIWDRFRDELYQREPLNPAVLALQLHDPRWQPSEAELDDRLWEVAQAGRPWRSYFGDSGRRLMQAMLSVPVTPDLIETHKSNWENLSPAATHPQALNPEQEARFAAAMLALGYHMAQVPAIGFQQLVNACHFQRQPERSERRRQACAALGQRMAEQPELLIDWRIGAVIWRRALRAAGLDEAPALEQTRRSEWLLHLRYDFNREGELEQIDALIDSTLRGETELDSLLGRLRDAGLDPLPPPDWLPTREGWDQLR